MRSFLLVFVTVFVFISVAFVIIAIPANAVIFWYGDEVDQQNSINYANSKPYDAYDSEDFENPDQYKCFSLDVYNSFAESHPYDMYDELTSANIKTDDLNRLRRDDYNRLANQNSHDGIKPDDVESYSDTHCWTLSDYNGFAETKPYDQFRPVFFQDFDDLETVQEIGKDRTHFFEAGDFAKFDLQRTQPRRFGLSTNDWYHPSNHNYYGSNRGANFYVPYGATDFRTIGYR